MPISGYFDEVFANSGNILTTVPDAVQVDGSISYTDGWGPFYSQDPAVDPSTALLIDRAQTNQLFNDVTTALQYFQQGNAAPFITSTMNGGSAYSYPAGATVLYSGTTYRSLKASNTVTPINDGVNWTVVSNRYALTANTSFYVATTGSDSTGDGTSGSPWATIPHAISFLQSTVDLAGHTATINVADGTYTAGINLTTPFTGSGAVQLTGDTATPANCIISVASGNCILVSNGAVLLVNGFNLASAAGGGIVTNQGGKCIVNGNMNYGACQNAHMESDDAGSYISVNANYTISGGASNHLSGTANSEIVFPASNTITLSGTPAFITSFAEVSDGAVLRIIGQTFSGSATGARYISSNNAIIDTNGAGASYLPGNSGGTGTNAGTSPYGLYN